MASVRLTSWLGGTFLGEIPVVDGSWKVTDQAGVKVPGTLDFSVPATAEWKPTTPGHPLAAMGQRIWAQVDQGDGWRTWGWFRAKRPKVSGSLVACQGQGLLCEIERFRFLTSVQPVIGDTRVQILKTLVGGIMPVVVSGVSDIYFSQPVSWEESRIDALWELLDSWPARAEVREQALWILPAWDDSNPGAPVVNLIDGPGGTLVSLDPADDDTDAYNGYRVSTVPAGDEAAVVRLWTMPDGPMKWGGPYGCNPGFQASPLNPTDPGALLAIAERLTRRDVAAGRTVTFTAVPSLVASVGQIARVRSVQSGVDGIGRITSVELTRSALTGSVAMLS